MKISEMCTCADGVRNDRKEGDREGERRGGSRLRKRDQGKLGIGAIVWKNLGRRGQ